MCDRHSAVLVDILTASARGTFGRLRGIDACIAPIVAALNAGGIATVASCCGHGCRHGSIALRDGRELLVAADRETAQRVEAAWPLTCYGEPVGGDAA